MIEALRWPFKFISTNTQNEHKTDSRYQASSRLDKTSVPKPEALERDYRAPPRNISPLEQRVRDLIVVPEDELDPLVGINIFMAIQWYRTFYTYPQDQETAAWIIADHLSEEHEYIVLKK